ncbi:MAG TPA: RNA-binding cell elongation regulator Jag/EloR [Acidimicrobiia bacterium]|nr:RNA-binding cell elongation regulator Jag/EloR [Acidimicrobiia bacterium]
MSYVEIEVRARTVDLAVEAAMQELGVDDKDQLAVEVIQEPEKGFLGFGGQDAVVRVKRRRSRRRRNERKREGKGQAPDRSSKQSGRISAKNDDGRQRGQRNQTQSKGRHMSQQGEKREPKIDDRPEMSIEEQARIAAEFLEGLVDAFGLEGTVTTKIDEDVIVADVDGEQTEALVGVRGSVRSAIHELTRTVMQRYAHDTARLRLDIAGYAERRRQALTIYAERLIDQLLEEGGEIMLEPMSPADRKVIHDAAAARDGVNSYSEGEAPRRYVVLNATAPVGETTGDDEEDGEEAGSQAFSEEE